jgi:hypothetical protein
MTTKQVFVSVVLAMILPPFEGAASRSHELFARRRLSFAVVIRLP